MADHDGALDADFPERRADDARLRRRRGRPGAADAVAPAAARPVDGDDPEAPRKALPSAVMGSPEEPEAPCRRSTVASGSRPCGAISTTCRRPPATSTKRPAGG